MNILRIIPAREERQWVDLLFQEGPYTEPDAPDYPLTFPLSVRLSKNVLGGYLYVVYASRVIGYSKIIEVRPHSTGTVGKEKNRVSSGDTLVLEGPLQRLPYDKLPCRGFRGFRYTEIDLHAAGRQSAEAELKEIGLFPL